MAVLVNALLDGEGGWLGGWVDGQRGRQRAIDREGERGRYRWGDRKGRGMTRITPCESALFSVGQ